MNQITLYVCEHCDYSTTSMHECLAHEAGHYGLTPDEYQSWRELHHSAAQAGIRIGTTRNDDTSQAFDMAISNLVAFEVTHGITGRKPRHFL